MSGLFDCFRKKDLVLGNTLSQNFPTLNHDDENFRTFDAP